ncbi:15481_t:CDS:2, partial [Cetraspora pellucida]
MDNASPLSFNRGLIINAERIQLSDFIAYELQPQHKNDPIINTSFHARLVNSTTKKESFLLKNHVELSIDDLEHSQIFDTDDVALLTDETPTNDIFLIIQCTKVELIIKKESIKPSDELTCKVKEALKHYDPYHKLMDVFNSYGHFLPRKIILGHKIYRMTYLSVGNNSLEYNDKNNVKWTTLDDFPVTEFEDVLGRWEKFMSSYNFDLSYLVSINGEFIMKDKLKDWIEFCLKSDLDSLQVISCKKLYPLYEIFDLSLRQEIENILGISRKFESIPKINNKTNPINSKTVKERVLMAGIVPIKDPPYSYSINFPVRFKSNNYQVFGKLIQDDEPIDDIIIKFDFMDTQGFLIFIENYKLINKNSKISWILIGIPAEIGYFSTITRKINVLGSGSEPFELKPYNYVVLKVPENLPRDSVIVISYKYPPSNYEPNFVAEIRSYQNNKILLRLYCPNYESSDSEEYNEDYIEGNVEDYIEGNIEDYSKENIEENVEKKNIEGYSEENVENSIDTEMNKHTESYNQEFINKNSANNEDSKKCSNIKSKTSVDSNDIAIDVFGYENFNYDENNPINTSIYSIQWFILQNSDTTNLFEKMNYLNKIGQEFHLKTEP